MLLNNGATLTRLGLTDGLFRLSFLAAGQGYFYEGGGGGRRRTAPCHLSEIGS